MGLPAANPGKPPPRAQPMKSDTGHHVLDCIEFEAKHDMIGSNASSKILNLKVRYRRIMLQP